MSLFPALNFRRETAEAMATSAYRAMSATGSSSRHASTPEVGRPSQSASNEISKVFAKSGSSTIRPTSRFSVAEPSAQFMLEKWIRRVAPHFVEIERIDRKSPLRRGEEVEDSLGVE